MALSFMYITNDPQVALTAEENGVERIWIDLEVLGKDERQKNMNTVKSHHSIQDIMALRSVIKKSKLLVRINPINPNSKSEIDAVIEAGADMIMLPMWKSLAEVKAFVGYVSRRVKTTLLLETKEAVDCLDDVLDFGGFDEIHIGLNDLHLSYGLNFMFELLSNGTVEALCHKFKRHGLPYGFGGIARLDGGLLPAKNVIMEHYRLGSTRAILSRSFCNAETTPNYKEVFRDEMTRLRDYEKTLAQMTESDFSENQSAIANIVRSIVIKTSESQKPSTEAQKQ